MDNLAVRVAGPGALVVDINNLREPGFYHHMQKQELQAMISTVSSLNRWGAQCLMNNISCGKYYTIEPGGRGSLVILQALIGPFQ